MFLNIINDIINLTPKYTNDLKELNNYQRRFIDKSECIDLISPFVINKGKRLRSIIYFDNWDNNSKVSNDTKYQTMALIELMHFASIVHDDVVDNNNIRRNNDSFMKKYGRKSSILYGDYVLIKAINEFLKLHQNNDFIKNIFLKEVENTARGAILEQQLTIGSSFEDYLNVIHLKTASFFGLSAFLGKFLSTQDHEAAQESYNYGIQFGVIYQAQNDIDCYKYDDYLYSEDFVQNNITLPIVALSKTERKPQLFEQNQTRYNHIKNFIKSKSFQSSINNLFNEQITYFKARRKTP